MWSPFAKSAAAVVAPEPEPVEVAALPEGLTEEYAALAAQLGIQGPSLQIATQQRQDAFTQFLRDAGIRQYPRDRVAAYLNAQYKRVAWGWRAVRDKDSPYYSFGRGLGHYMASSHGSPSSSRRS